MTQLSFRKKYNIYLSKKFIKFFFDKKKVEWNKKLFFQKKKKISKFWDFLPQQNSELHKQHFSKQSLQSSTKASEYRNLIAWDFRNARILTYLCFFTNHIVYIMTKKNCYIICTLPNEILNDEIYIFRLHKIVPNSKMMLYIYIYARLLFRWIMITTMKQLICNNKLSLCCA